MCLCRYVHVYVCMCVCLYVQTCAHGQFVTRCGSKGRASGTEASERAAGGRGMQGFCDLVSGLGFRVSAGSATCYGFFDALFRKC